MQKVARTSMDKQNRKVLIPTFQSVEIACVKDILYIEAFENYCKVFFVSGESITLSQSFGSFCNQVMNTGFFQCHKSYTVNFSYIIRFLKLGSIELYNGTKLPVARRRKDDFLEGLKEWCKQDSLCSTSTIAPSNNYIL